MFRKALFRQSTGIHAPKINMGHRPYHQTAFVSFKSPVHVGATNHLVSIHNGAKSFDSVSILEDLNLNITREDHIMLFGANGSGKSTLVKLLIGELELDSGYIKIKHDTKIGYLPQDIDDFTAKFGVQSISDYLFKPFPELLALSKQRIDLQLNLEKSSDRTKKYDNEKKIAMLTKVINEIGGYRVETILNGLKIFDISLNKSFTQLSGGEKCRVALSGLLLQEPDLLILDEPTNHLDSEGRKWLQKYLANFNKAILIITHDRELMSTVGNRIFYLNAAERIPESFKECKQLKEPESPVHKFEDKKQKLFFDFVATRCKPNSKILSVVNLSKHISNLKSLNQISFQLQFGERMVITGSNGSGKSTLLKILMGIEMADSGRVNFENEANIGYMPQDYSDLTPTMTLIDAFSYDLNISQTQSYKILKSVGFTPSEHFSILVKDLSVGQKRRLQFARLIGKGCNVLLLDEPTNHLDVLSMEQFESDLLNFHGTIIAVSYDENFINKIATRVFNLSEGNLLEDSSRSLYQQNK